MAPHGAAAEAGASGFMCSFPLINGTYACENAYVMNKMRAEYGFKGSIVPDFPNAQHSVAAALTAGCDACSTTYGGTTLQAEVAAGRVSTATLDQMIYSRVVSSFRIGLTDNPPAGAPNSDDVRSDAHNRVTRELAADGAVLLKNRHRGLPLSNHARSIAVIGPSASAAPITDISGAGYVPPAAGAVVTPLQGIQDRAPAGTTINYAQGAAPVGQQPSTAELPALGTDFTATYFGTPDWSGPAVLTQVEHGVRLDGGIPNDAVAPGASNGAGGTIKINGWSVRYTGSFTVPTTGTYVFSIGNGGETRLSIDGAPVAHTNGGQFGYATQVAQRLRAGRVVTLRLDYTPRDAAVGIIPPRLLPLEVAPTIKIGPYVHLGMVGPDTATSGTVASPDALIADAVAKARASEVAVVFVSESEGEGVDRSTMELPGAQDALVEAVARANRHTIVVLNTGGAVAMPWLDDVKSVLEMWYPGDQFGRAAADLLFGDAEPGGRLPITWPASERQGPGQTPRDVAGRARPEHDEPHLVDRKVQRGRERRLPLLGRVPPEAAVPVRVRAELREGPLRPPVDHPAP